MCTVVFIPNNDSFLFASLRDESPVRPKAIQPNYFSSNETTYLAPKDALAGGTWLGAGQSGTVIILLNGAFNLHQRQEPYRKSRGLIVTEMLSSKSPLSLWDKMDLNQIEPFTLIVLHANELQHLAWDGKLKHVSNKDMTKPQIWSSSTLYTIEAKEQRQLWFNAWIQSKPIFSSTALISFFKSISDPFNGFIMNRENKVGTLSYTFMEVKKSESVQMEYHDFATNQIFSETLELVKPAFK